MKYWIVGSLIGMSIVITSYADIAEEKGLAIAVKVSEADSGWGNSTARLKMVLRNRQGDKSERSIRLKNLEILGDGDKSLSIFDNPRDVKGTAFLTFSHSVKADDQWLYLPALKRVKRISSSNKSGPFMGSQFAYEDLASFEVEKYHYKFLRNETLGSIATSVVENFPNYKYSGYTRQIVWVDIIRNIPIRIEFYDRKNDLLKTLEFTQYKQYQGKYWRAHKQVMLNVQNGKTTVITMSDFKFNTGLNSADFNKTALKRSR